MSKFEELVRKPGVIPAAVGIAGFGGGLVVGYILGRRQQETTITIVDEFSDEDDGQLVLDFEKEEHEENARLLEEYTVPKDEDKVMLVVEDDVKPYLTIGEIIDKRMKRAAENLEAAMVEAVAVPEDTIEAVAVNVFGDFNDGWDWPTELAHRSDLDGKTPYVIHKEEYFGEESSWESQATLTYYVGDGVLASEDDSVINDIEGTIGPLRFGYGSGDPSVFYVRNPDKELEFEVVRHSGRYEIEVGGLALEQAYEQNDLKHFHQPGKFRDF